ncbi:hypothetical protein COY16_03490 [Candidatus Roizmanbacteria bacterium CG_4_10_14_0_2_um_filter_39_13]|uniref:Aminoglycoside phosphotransferase domain-containing protein n=1 Tax=Candidatus Roizmanbacteria bacterium CG_4_10_14_0_2_um_filter_39_13 TaxID=1974825 RepID=A0A2M7TYA3_9BACT|nr:MAG: hypothetical protein COY16_03490 [Candidatus Roizmanbacteria bacterium CG_4_10_14_0_2_um_filter_39_13]
MNKNIYILPVSVTFRNIKYPEKMIKSVEGLERRLKGKKLNISLGKQIHKDNMSNIYEATLDKAKVLVKHTENVVPETPIEFLIMSDAHDTEVRVLNRFESEEHIKAPKIIHNFPKYTTVITEDVRSQGYVSLSEQILNKKLSSTSAAQIGKSLAHLVKISQSWEEFKTNESAHLIFYEHSLEMLVAFPEAIDHYRFLEDQFTQYAEEKEDQEKRDRYFVWAESSPNNMFVNKKGEIIFSNFSRGYWGDNQFTLAVFIANIMVHSLLGSIARAKAIDYIKTCIKAYKDVTEIRDEYVFSQYVGMEILHRSFGKGMKLSSQKEKLLLQKLGLTIVEEKAKTITTLINQFKRVK